MKIMNPRDVYNAFWKHIYELSGDTMKFERCTGCPTDTCVIDKTTAGFSIDCNLNEIRT
jgi:hypothetical protein